MGFVGAGWSEFGSSRSGIVGEDRVWLLVIRNRRWLAGRASLSGASSPGEARYSMD